MKRASDKPEQARRVGAAAIGSARGRARGAPRAATGGRVARKASLAEQAYEAIKHLVLTCELRPGEYVNQSQLCERLGIGRTPVYQAISQLQQERFLDVMPRKGIIVRPLSLDEYFALDEARLLLEPAAMRLVVERITEQEMRLLDDVIEREQAARAARDIRELFLCDRDFHIVLARATHNTVIEQMVTSAYERSLRVWFMSSVDIKIAEKHDAHSEMMRAIASRDAERASALLREHILSSRALMLRTA